MKINLGSGYESESGYFNVDNDKRTKPDFLVDLEKGKLPFKDSVVSEVLAYNILEHINHLENLLKDLHRVMEPGAVLKVIVPYKDSQLCLNHVRQFDDQYFYGFDKEWYIAKTGQPHQYPFDFRIRKIKLNGNWFALLLPFQTWRKLWHHLIVSISVELVCVK